MRGTTFGLMCGLTFALAANSPVIASGCADWRVGPLSENTAALNGTNGFVSAVTSWDPDGNGPQPAMLVIGGSFTTVEGVSITNIAARNGVTGQWLPLGALFNGSVLTLSVFNGQLIAGGSFSYIGANQYRNIARWDGVTWHTMGAGPQLPVAAMTTYNGQLYAGLQGSASGSHLLRWDGSSWQPLAIEKDVYALTVYNGELIAGGLFQNAGSTFAYHIGRWDGVTWRALGDHVDGVVFSLIVFENTLIAGGYFDEAGFNPAHNIARWNGSAWQAMGDGFGGKDPWVESLEVYNGSLYAGGGFSSSGSVNMRSIARWDGSVWQPLSNGGVHNGTYCYVVDLQVHAGELVLSGQFGFAGNLNARNIARWNGSQWQSFGGVGVNSVNAFANFGSRLVAAGDFVQAGVNSGPPHHIVEWDGIDLAPFGTGMNAPIFSLCSFTYGGLNGDNELIAGGSFISAGGVSANRIARWIEDPVTGFPAPQWEAMGNGFNGSVSVITRFNGRTVAGGYFTASGNGATTLSRIARWNETTDAWEAMGTGHNGAVAALRAYTVSSQLVRVVAGGYFPGGVSAWTETTQVPSTPVWTTLGTGFNGAALALEHHGGSLYAGGEFTFAGATAVNRIARFDTVPNPDVWVPVGNGLGFNGSVTALRSHNGMLYASGDFTSVDGIPANRLAVWNGTVWQEVQGGADNSVLALGIYHDELHVGGTFNTVRNGVIASKGWAKYLITGMPWMYEQPDNASVTCNQHAYFYSYPAYGYGGLGFEWRKDGVPLANGPTGTGSHILNRGPLLDIFYPSVADEGMYELALSSDGCGTVISSSATLDVIDNCQPCPSDANHDRMVNVSDLLLIITNWGACPPPPPIYTYAPPCLADLNADGQVNVTDLLRVITTWGACP